MYTVTPAQLAEYAAARQERRNQLAATCYYLTTGALEPFPRMTPQRDFAYYGDRADWYIVLSVHRDSHALDRSNWRVIVADLKAAHPDAFATESCSHWAVGYVEYLLLSPDVPTEALDAILAWHEKLSDYPVADDDDFSDLEYDEAPQCPDCHTRHYLPSGEYDESRYDERCAECNARNHMIGHLWNHPHRPSAYGSALTRLSPARRRRMALQRARRHLPTLTA